METRSQQQRNFTLRTDGTDRSIDPSIYSAIGWNLSSIPCLSEAKETRATVLRAVFLSKRLTFLGDYSRSVVMSCLGDFRKDILPQTAGINYLVHNLRWVGYTRSWRRLCTCPEKQTKKQVDKNVSWLFHPYRPNSTLTRLATSLKLESHVISGTSLIMPNFASIGSRKFILRGL
jgi:hypothetical protein